MKVVFARDLLKQGVAVVLERPAVSIPIHSKSVNAKISSLLDLLLQHGRILRRVSRIHVTWRAEPRLIVRQKFWSVVNWVAALIQRLAKFVAITSLTDDDYAGKNQANCGRTLHS